LRFRDGKVVKSGPQIKIDDGTEEVFLSVCRKHFTEQFYRRSR
jgi:thymidine kinase